MIGEETIEYFHGIVNVRVHNKSVYRSDLKIHMRKLSIRLNSLLPNTTRKD